jgi:deoxyribodipyrimidine photo-lyase
VETDCVVPQLRAHARSPNARAEFSAATFRPKVLARVPTFTQTALPKFPYGYGPLDDAVRAVFLETVSDYDMVPLGQGVSACLKTLDAHGLIRDPNCPRVTSHVGGESRALAKLDIFFTTKMLSRYAQGRNDPALRLQSHLSPHIHYGQVSVVAVARRALDFKLGHQDNQDIVTSVDVFLEELIVRRELAVNFALRNPHYDTYEGLPEWARDTLQKHADDRREWVYTLEQFEQGQTHDKLWNASQRELVTSGKQHNYLRMYWGKKILEWSATPKEAWHFAITLNNRYSLDGRNMVSYTGVGWCFGLHDREFFEADISGTIRRFSEAGMRKRFPSGMKGYLDRWGDETSSSGQKRQLRMEDMFTKRPKV